jgi:hypothetical protein
MIGGKLTGCVLRTKTVLDMLLKLFYTELLDETVRPCNNGVISSKSWREGGGKVGANFPKSSKNNSENGKKSHIAQ